MKPGVEILGFEFYELEGDECHIDTIVRALYDYFGVGVEDMSKTQLLKFCRENIYVVRDYGMGVEERLEIKNYWNDELTQEEIEQAIDFILDTFIGEELDYYEP
jgi:hypothetical protein